MNLSMRELAEFLGIFLDSITQSEMATTLEKRSNGRRIAAERREKTTFAVSIAAIDFAVSRQRSGAG